MDKLIEFFMKYLKASEEDAIVGSMFALGGLTIDLLFFPAGMGTGIVTAISAGTGLLLSRFYRKTPFYKNRVLRGIDKLEKSGHITQQEVKKYKDRLIKIWQKQKEEGA